MSPPASRCPHPCLRRKTTSNPPASRLTGPFPQGLSRKVFPEARHNRLHTNRLQNSITTRVVELAAPYGLTVSDMATVVAAGYADWRRFDGLSATGLVRAAAAAECDLVMVDTYIKDGASLFDNMSVDELKTFVREGHEAGLKVALAGSIKIEHADLLFDIGPDVVGVRGAVCEDSSNRHTRISPQKTDDFVALFAAEGGRREGKVA